MNKNVTIDVHSTKLINSHIQMPKFLLKRFHNEYNKFFCYNVQRNYIESNRTAKSTNTELGYFSNSTENYLNRKIEGPFSKLLKRIETIDFDQEYFRAPEGFDQTTKKFMCSLIARDPLIVRKASNNSVYLQFLPSYMNHDYCVRTGICFAQDNNFFSEFVLTFIVNCTNTPFVLPIKGLYSYEMNGHCAINLPISPTLALCLVHKNYASHLIRDDGTTDFFRISFTEQIETLNFFAFMSQKRHNCGCVICPQQEELIRLVQFEGS